MPDTKAGKPRKAIEKKKYLQVINVLKVSIEVMTIIKYILDLGVNLTVDKLLTLALAIEKQLIKAITEDEAMQLLVNTLESSFADARNSYLQYSIGSLKARIRLEDESKITVLLDTYAEINIITREVIENTNLAIMIG